MADLVVLVDSAPVVVGPLVGGSVLVVVASVVVVGAAVVVGAVVVVDAAVVVGRVTGGWVLVTPTAENASLLVVGPAAAGPSALVGLLMTCGPVAAVGVERLGVVVDSRGRSGPSTPILVPAGSGRSLGRRRGADGAGRIGAAGWPRRPGLPGHRW